MTFSFKICNLQCKSFILVHFELILTKYCGFEGDRFSLNNIQLKSSTKHEISARYRLHFLNHRRLKIGLKRLKICQNEAKGLVDTDFEEKLRKITIWDLKTSDSVFWAHPVFDALNKTSIFQTTPTIFWHENSNNYKAK